MSFAGATPDLPAEGSGADYSDIGANQRTQAATLPFMDSENQTISDAFLSGTRGVKDWLDYRQAAIGAETQREFNIDPAIDPGNAPIDPKEYQKQFGNLGLTFTPDMGHDQAVLLVNHRLDELRREYVLDNSPNGWMAQGTRGATSFAVSALDPLNAAAVFVPGMAETRAGLLFAKYGETVADAAEGAVAGTTGMAAFQPLQYAQAQAYQDHYGPMDAFLNVAFGTVLGGGLHAGGGLMSDAMSRAAPETREAALRAAVGQAVEGRNIDVEPVLATDPAFARAPEEITPAASSSNSLTPDPTAEGIGSAPAPDATSAAPARAVESGDLWSMSAPELESLLREKTSSNREKLVQALGSEEEANAFARMDRARNSSDPVRADRAATAFDEKYGNLTPDQQRLVYGIGESDVQADDVQTVLKAHRDLQAISGDGSKDWAAYVAGLGVRKASAAEIRAVPAGGGTPAAQAAYVRLRGAVDAMRQAGVAADDVPKAIGDALIGRGGWHPAQVSELVGGFFRDAEAQIKTPDASAPRPPQPVLEQSDRARAADLIQKAKQRSLDFAHDQEPSAVEASPELRAQVAAEVRAHLGDDPKAELEDAMATLQGYKAQGVISDAEMQRFTDANAADADALKTGTEAAKAVARCLFLHP